MYENIIDREFINSSIIPFSSEESIFYGSVTETLLLDIKDKVGDDIYFDLMQNGSLPEDSGTTASTLSEQTQEYLDRGMRLAIGYYVVSRTFRKPSTPTRYGVTNKLSDNSENVSNSSAVSQSNYYKDIADNLMNRLLSELRPATYNSGFNCKILGD